MSQPHEDGVAVVETKLVHAVHRRAVSLLSKAVSRGSTPTAELVELRDFVVPMLRHHHETEDDLLWPLVKAAAPPSTSVAFAELSDEHEQLDQALDALWDAPITDNDRTAAAVAAATVRDRLHGHLDREEQILLPALKQYVSDARWQRFSRQTIVTAPTEGAHLMIGFLDEVGTPAEVDVILANLPDEARAVVPAMRQQARTTLTALRTAGSGSHPDRPT